MFLFVEFDPVIVTGLYVNEILKLKSVSFLFRYVNHDTNWTLCNGSPSPEVFYSDKIDLVEKINSKLSKSIRKSIEDIYGTGNINGHQLTKSFKTAVSFVLSNANFPLFSTVSKLHSISINTFSHRYISNTTTVTPFSKTVLSIPKNFAPEDKLVCQLLCNTSCKSEFVPVKRHTVNHVLCKSFLSLDFISVVSPVDVVNVSVKFTPLRSRFHVVKCIFHPLRVSVSKAPTISTINTVSPPNVCNIVSRINPTHQLCEAPQYIHTVLVNNPANTSYSWHERISCFLQPGTGFTRSALILSPFTLLSNKRFFLVISPISKIISCNSQQVSCSAKFILFWIFLM